jgi:uncharacterized protein YqiB (DUF1249 family)
MKKIIYETNFDRMVQLGIITPEGKPTFQAAKKIKNEPYMNLNLDLISRSEDEIIIAMAHNYIQEGDVMADPDMEIKILPKMHMIEALTFQQDRLRIFQRVYLEGGRFYPNLKKDLNSFLGIWLKNLIDQGFKA